MSGEANLYHEGAARVVEWMMRDGRHVTRMREFGDEMCRRIAAAGIPLWRALCSVATLHPQIAATAYIWRRDEPGAKRMTATHAFERDPAFSTSPIAEVQRTGIAIRRKLCDPACPIDYPVLEEFRQQAGTDYVAMPMLCSSGDVNAITWLTDHPGGFTEAEMAGLANVANALAIIVELQATRRIARHLMDTYVGHRTGERVLRGAITRGSGDAIRAVIWFCDLRGFTTLADSMPRERLLALLNDYFETMVNVVTEEGGEALKFMGDAMLAIFELGATEDPADRCSAALRAAHSAAERIAKLNLERRAAGEAEIHYGLALHLGEVTYGNIGSRTRLDFTVIGPAVNHAARLEKLGYELGRAVVTSASFAACSPAEHLESLGLHNLRGVTEAQEVFAPTIDRARAFATLEK
ncbi:MAG: adenylate/guanylate cyclase domain-containing protein [Candidatus Binatus sp.]|uniref:adenylate/guanylate cyclase domain-containing protein n=1 Tax=Candidatus Binatus sp. TaxID=2811406 RepID=UPI00271F3793|nr:adenylate/guanylate cyclase domain-containing protein [Candidatus Binatus sp.]MDO8434490.1 adenylate/guanylate cyclase domain-containing protein [Candidatus Binatus sp.]